MDRLIEFICEELEELEQKVMKEHKLSAQEIQYMDTLAHAKKNLMKAMKMEEEDEYSMRGGSYRGSYRGGSYRGGSYARGRGRSARRDSMGRYASEGGSSGASYEDGYSRAESDLAEKLQHKITSAPDERTRRILQDLMEEI